MTINIPDGVNLVDEANIESGPGIIIGPEHRCLCQRRSAGAHVRQSQGTMSSGSTFAVSGGYLKYPQQWPRQFKYRSWLLRSQDGGRSWHYFSTIAAFPELGDEGPCEPNITLMPDGSLLAVLRNGGGDTGPLWISRSRDNGRTWSVPVRTTVTGNYPSLVPLSNGVLACLYGRPNNRVSFDRTGSGLAWSHTVVLFNGRGNDHVEGAELSPGQLFCVYEDNEFDPDGHPLANGLRQWYGVCVTAHPL